MGDVAAVGVVVLCQGTSTLEYLVTHHFGRFVKVPPPWSALIVTRLVLCQGTTTLECLNAPTSSVTPDLPVLRRHRHFDFDPETVLPRPCSWISPSIAIPPNNSASSSIIPSMLYMDLARVGFPTGYLDKKDSLPVEPGFFFKKDGLELLDLSFFYWRFFLLEVFSTGGSFSRGGRSVST